MVNTTIKLISRIRSSRPQREEISGISVLNTLWNRLVLLFISPTSYRYLRRKGKTRHGLNFIFLLFIHIVLNCQLAVLTMVANFLPFPASQSYSIFC